MPEPNFEECVFINCPFDDDYAPLLQAILFCLIYVEYQPRLASERIDSAELRLLKIRELIRECKYSIHDLSRSRAKVRGEHYRLNMPFELGIDYGCREYYGNGREEKRILILEEERHRYQAALSDLAGCDAQAHAGDVQKAIRKVRNWLVSEAGIRAPGARHIFDAYYDFQEWHYKRQVAAGFSEDDIQDYPTSELLTSMRDWIAEGKPL